MCTVSFVKLDNGFILTSNRDEQSSRPTIAPRVYEELGQQLVYPKDEIAGGTWIANSDAGISVCLLNGGFKKHKRQLPYNRSRGLVLKERFGFSTNEAFIKKVDLNNVEPFTLLMIDHRNLDDIDFSVLVWDGIEKHFSNIDTSEPQIWASSTLYNLQQRQTRKLWFDQFLKHNSRINASALLSFHTGSFTKDKKEDMLMIRSAELKTISVSQISITSKDKSFYYKNLEQNTTHTLNLDSLCKTV